MPAHGKLIWFVFLIGGIFLHSNVGVGAVTTCYVCMKNRGHSVEKCKSSLGDIETCHGAPGPWTCGSQLHSNGDVMRFCAQEIYSKLWVVDGCKEVPEMGLTKACLCSTDNCNNQKMGGGGP